MSKQERIRVNLGGNVNVQVREVDNAVIVAGIKDGTHKETVVLKDNPDFDTTLQAEVDARTSAGQAQIDEVVNTAQSDFNSQKSDLQSLVDELKSEYPTS
ncbi:hypothetical protein [Fodinibius sp. SL11]|uniref:hypothetical protein n=1 Tax=Fodinibius sp. SL11 TaxID=3425690 RepID=UPI003F88476A